MTGCMAREIHDAKAVAAGEKRGEGDGESSFLGPPFRAENVSSEEA